MGTSTLDANVRRTGLVASTIARTFGLWEAELVLLAVDYDGGRKALVRFPTIGRSIVPGSQLYTADGQPWPVDG